MGSLSRIEAAVAMASVEIAVENEIQYLAIRLLCDNFALHSRLHSRLAVHHNVVPICPLKNTDHNSALQYACIPYNSIPVHSTLIYIQSLILFVCFSFDAKDIM